MRQITNPTRNSYGRRMSNGWTLARRNAQAIAIRRWRPWERSSGPRTPEGKARSSRNADRGDQRGLHRELAKMLNADLRVQRRAFEEVRETDLELRHHLR